MKINPLLLAFSLLFLFVIQTAGILVESIYILDLMNTRLDEKALGVLFFFSPVGLFLIHRPLPIRVVGIFCLVLLGARGLIPYLDTLGRMIAAGIGIGVALVLLPVLATATPRRGAVLSLGLSASVGLALAMSVSILLRTVNHTLDFSLTPEGGWLGWAGGLLLGWCLMQLHWEEHPAVPSSQPKVAAPLLGIYLILTLCYFAFSAPAVIARWTQGNYTLIVATVSLLAVVWVYLALNRPGILSNLSARVLLLWNLVFTMSLTATILVQRVVFPPTPDSPAVVVTGTPTGLQQIALFLMLLTFPVIFLDLAHFFDALQTAKPALHQIAPGMLLGSLALVLLVFISIFTNVWGYVEPVSTIFRNQFHLPYLLIGGFLTLLIWRNPWTPQEVSPRAGSSGWNLTLLAIFLGTVLFAVRTERIQPAETGGAALVVMTYNIQQANDDLGERSYQRQLDLIRQVSPDILALQESDAARISFNNNDYVRYYAAQLGYYAYYGPTPVTGTFGTAILSRYPLHTPRAVFTFSDLDEIGTAEAEIVVDGHTFTLYNVHPDGSDLAMQVFARSLLARASAKEHVILLGDLNLRDEDAAFQLIADSYTNAWTSVYPSKVGADGTDMSGRNRIDHIFFSPDLTAKNPVYLLPPDSATDHPVHWTEIIWIGE